MEGSLTQDSFTRPEEVISQLGSVEGKKVADFGTGHGYFSIPMAKAVGKEGAVYALDIQKSALEAVKSRAVLDNISNLQTIWANLETVGGTKLENNSVDVVFIKNVLFQSEKKEDILKEAWRVLANDGQLVIIDWQPSASREIGPREGWLIDSHEAQSLIGQAGFKFIKDLSLDQYHFGFIFKK